MYYAFLAPFDALLALPAPAAAPPPPPAAPAAAAALASLRFFRASIRCFSIITLLSASSLLGSAVTTEVIEMVAMVFDLLSSFLLFQAVHNLLALLFFDPRSSLRLCLLRLGVCCCPSRCAVLLALLSWRDRTHWRGLV